MPAAHFDLLDDGGPGVYVSADDGASWLRWGNNLPLVNVTDLNFSIASLVRAATYGRGFWEIVP